MDLLTLILDRFVIHFFASTSLVALAFFFIRWIVRKLQSSHPVDLMRWFPIVLSGLLVFAVSATREAVDVANGQPLIKAFTDYLSWFLGCAASVYAIHRLTK